MLQVGQSGEMFLVVWTARKSCYLSPSEHKAMDLAGEIHEDGLAHWSGFALLLKIC